MRKEIDGNKFDIRVICSTTTSSPDAGYVDGVPIDPPDDSPGWLLVDLWVEHDTEQETVVEHHEDESGKKKERKKLVTRLVNPAHYQLWVKPKPPPAKKARAKKVAAAAPTVAKPEAKPDNATATRLPGQPKKKRGRAKKAPAAAAPANGESGEAPGVTLVDVSTEEFLQYCEHQREVMVVTINEGEQRPITMDDLRAFSLRCHDCKQANGEAMIAPELTNA